MARSRNIKPGFMVNDRLPELGAEVHLFYACLWMVADREGRLEDRPKKIKAECMPHYDCDIDKMLRALASGQDPFIRRYSVNGDKFIQILAWKKHQSPHHTEKESVIPASPLSNGEYPLFNDQLAPSTVSGIRNQASEIRNPESEIRDQGSTPKKSKFEPPTVDEVSKYCDERHNQIDPEVFVDFYTGKGWKIGKNNMVDWQAAVRTWEKNESRAGPTAGDPTGNITRVRNYINKLGSKSNG